MSIGKELISKEIGRLKRGVTYAKKAMSSLKDKVDKTGYSKSIELYEKDITQLEKDLKKL